MMRVALVALLLLASPVSAAGPNPRGVLRIEPSVTEVRVITEGEADTVILDDATGCVQLMGPASVLIQFPSGEPLCDPYDAVVTGTPGGTQKWFAFTRRLVPDAGSVAVHAQDQDGGVSVGHVFRCVRKNPRLTVCKS